MTEAQQKRFYFPAWQACAAANEWKMSRGRLLADLAAQRSTVAAAWSEPAREVCLKVLTTAEQIAAQQHRSVTADDLRRGCNVVAGGKVSSFDLDNKQTNRVVALFELLTDPENLAAVTAWLHPENAERGSFISFLRKQAHEGIIISICKNAFDTGDWESLDLAKLRWIAKHLKNREPRRGTATSVHDRRRRSQSAATVERHSSGREYDPENAAF